MIEYFSLTGLLIEPERHIILCASGSVVEYRLAKARVPGSNPVSRSYKRKYHAVSFRKPYFFVQKVYPYVLINPK